MSTCHKGAHDLTIYVSHLWGLALLCTLGYLGQAFLGFVKIENALPAAVGIILFCLIATGHAWLWSRE